MIEERKEQGRYQHQLASEPDELLFLLLTPFLATALDEAGILIISIETRHNVQDNLKIFLQLNTWTPVEPKFFTTACNLWGIEV